MFFVQIAMFASMYTKPLEVVIFEALYILSDFFITILGLIPLFKFCLQLLNFDEYVLKCI